MRSERLFFFARRFATLPTFSSSSRSSWRWSCWSAFILLFFTLCDGGANAGKIVTDDEYKVSNKYSSKCVPITIDMCRDIEYNQTIFPNLLKHSRQEEAEAEIRQYEMLVKVKCSAHFKFFLCTMFAPVCSMFDYPIPPCRHLCLSAKAGCDDLMRKFGYFWPEVFDCDKLPVDGICVGDNRQNSELSTTAAPHGENDASGHQRNELECPHTMKILSRTKNTLWIANSSVEQCSLPCHSDGVVPPLFFGAHVRHYLRLWTGAWAVACCVCTLFTILTFLIDLHRFEFPERAILYMALCYLVVSATYMVGLVAEDGLSCSGLSATKAPLVTQGTENFACTAMAVIHYFFTTAGVIWWVILCFSWFLVTTLKWGEAPVEQVFFSYFNFVAWFLPGLAVIAILVMNAIDGDIFTGICSVGNLQPSVLFNFVVVPQTILIVVGLLFFVCGFVSIIHILSYIRGQQHIAVKYEGGGAPTEKVSKLMFRISTFTVLYILPLIVGELCTYYQSAHMESWLTTWYSTRCLHAQRSAFGFTQPREFCPISGGGGVLPEMLAGADASVTYAQPDLNNQASMASLFFIKYLSHFTAGIACAVWAVNGKTFSSYGDFYVRVVYGRARVPTRVH